MEPRAEQPADRSASPPRPALERAFVVGLGNPGRRYEGTRHNVGFRVLEVLRCRWDLGEGKEAFAGLAWDARPVRGERTVRVTLLAPMTYMNDSGRAVRNMLDFYKVPPGEANLLVVLDDLALELGRLRARASGSAGGHNGLEDILRCCGTNEIHRLRVGIGAAPGAMDPRDYVLGVFGEDEREDIGAAVETAADAVVDWIFRGMRKVMDTYN
jgi:PTH1 family peptidyl-tRNA hydrolase